MKVKGIISSNIIHVGTSIEHSVWDHILVDGRPVKLSLVKNNAFVMIEYTGGDGKPGCTLVPVQNLSCLVVDPETK